MTDCSTKTSRTRNQNLLLQRLGGHGLIAPLQRRVGGFGGGSTLQVWHLTEAGLRLLSLNDPGVPPRKRFFEPSTMFLEHTLAIAEFAVQLTCLCRDSHDLTLEVLDAEPSCWRRFLKFSTSATCTSAITTPASSRKPPACSRSSCGS
ncbi:MAG: replication-relaxation family protein [Ruthenibacterium lactatiformans]|uniref:replication-relaxation family protein n=1 Tax=Ruthenibacterium lactatiformans TaxID=1550024 RepID=UPI003461DE62